MATMVSLCWSKSEALVVVKSFKFIELAAANMLAVTNLAICINLALIVSVRAHYSLQCRSARVSFVCVSLWPCQRCLSLFLCVFSSGYRNSKIVCFILVARFA